MANPDSRFPDAARRVTIRDIARELDLHFTTVAEALRGSPRISEKTRKAVRETARRLGYRPDPALSALSAYRTLKQNRVFQGVLAWIYSHPRRDFFESASGFYQDCYAGACERAKQYGFNVEQFWLGEPNLTAARAVKILQARNISGLLIAPQPLGTDHIDIPWEQFCSVRIGYSLRDVPLPIVAPDQFQNTFLLYHKLREKGFTRIGFVCPRKVDERVSNGFSGGYLSARELDGRQIARLPLYFDTCATGDPEAFLRWFRRSKPDAIMVIPAQIYQDALVQAGFKVPRDVSVAWISIFDLSLDVTGIDESGQQVGETSVDILSAQINRNALGIPPYLRKTLIPGKFIEGATCRVKGKL